MENRNYLLLAVLLLAHVFGLHYAWGQTDGGAAISGTVYIMSDSLRSPNAFVNVRMLPSNSSVRSDGAGKFSFVAQPGDRTVIFSKVGFAKLEFSVAELLARKAPLSIFMDQDQKSIEEVNVSSGYQKLKQGAITGSVDVVDQELFNRTAGATVLQRLENITPGLLFNRGDAQSTDEFLIRGRSTITAEAQPLIVLDNFPFDGNLDDINPLDIESVTILKDAAAASIWGARAGNGVIVLTSKKGASDRVNVNFQSSLALQGRPDLYNVQTISSADRLEVDRFLYEQGHYAASFTGPYYNRPVPNFVELLAQGQGDMAALQEELSSIDVRDDLSRYFYQNRTQQQHNVSFSGGRANNTFYYSAGYTEDLGALVGQKDQRVNISARQNFGWDRGPKISMGLIYTDAKVTSGNNMGIETSASGRGFSPYADLVDANGNGLPIYSDYRKPYVDSVGGGLLKDWSYSPYDEIFRSANTENRRDLQANVSLEQGLGFGLKISAFYKFQFQQRLGKQEDFEDSYIVRDRINNFSRIDYARNSVVYNIPQGGFLLTNDNQRNVHQGRIQLDYHHSSADGRHSLDAIAGYEIRKLTDRGQQYQFYGYRPEIGGVNSTVDNLSYFQMLSSGATSRIGLLQGMSGGFDHFLSMYANANYSYQGRYQLYGSFRKDEANLFGVATNQKGTPLWSIGGGWSIDREPWWEADWARIKLRTTYGVNGNISRAASAQQTINFASSGRSHSFRSARITTPSNDQLRWENVRVFNVGSDVDFFNSKISGSIDYYVKNSTDLLARVPVNSTLGVQTVFANAANMQGKGLDLQLNTNLRLRGLNYRASLIASWNENTVTRYLMPVSSSGSTYLPITINPIEGRTLYAVNSFEFQGLDPQNGNPIGLLSGVPSSDYSALYNTTPLSELKFHGSAQPTFFGAFRNTFSYRDFEISFNLSYKTGYYFRRQSLYYSGLFATFGGHSDYADRWQDPGDELSTNVPSMVYPQNTNRDNFYSYSSALVERGDHIRLEDVLLSYLFRFRNASSVRVFANFQNLNMILWKAAPGKIDPYFNNVVKDRMVSTVGLSFSL